MTQQASTLETNKEKSEALQAILLQRIAEEDRTPIKMIEVISGNKQAKKVLYNFVAYEFEPEYSFDSEHKPNPAFEGSADSTSYRLDLETMKTESGLSNENPVTCQATVFIDNVVNYEL